MRIHGYSRLQIFMATTFVVTARNCNNNFIQDPSSIRNGRRSKILQNDVEKTLQTDSNPKQMLRNRCCPYDFDANFCKVVDDRVLCGYNKNLGNPKSKDSAVYIHGGCRIRAGRLECGYEQGPYTNPRRPPVWDNPPHIDKGDNPGDYNNPPNKPIGETTVTPIMAVTRCVEVDGRIVCKKI